MALPVSRQLPSPEQATEPAHSAISDAVADLYQACHLPRPAVIVTPDPARFARAVSVFSRSYGAEMVGLSVFASLNLLMVVGSIFGAKGLALISVLTALFNAPLLYIMTAELARSGPSLFKALRQGLIVLGVTTTAAVLGWLIGLDGPMRASAAGAVASGTVLAMACVLMLRPAFRRRRVSRNLGSGPQPLSWRIPYCGSRSVNGVITSRLESALSDRNSIRRRAGPIDSSSSLRGHRERNLQNTIEAEFRRIDGMVRNDMPLGQSIGFHFQTPALISHLAVHQEDFSKLPRVLQAAVRLDRLVDAVFAFQDVVVVLPIHTPSQSVNQAATTSSGWRRSRRAPWQQVLTLLDAEPILLFAIDAAPSQAIADRFLARRILHVAEAAERTPAIQQMGVSRFARAAALKPVTADDVGELYRFGSPEDPSVFARVCDKVMGVDGNPLTHWISVPPHTASTREAVAWSFGMSEMEYAPARES